MVIIIVLMFLVLQEIGNFLRACKGLQQPKTMPNKVPFEFIGLEANGDHLWTYKFYNNLHGMLHKGFLCQN